MACFSYHGKSIFYEECGQGTPLIFLHGNTASSKLFLPILALYSGRYRCICPDFLGNGRSDRVEAFPTDLWQDEGRQVIALIRHLNCGKACLVGTSGGAWAALNAALEGPEPVSYTHLTASLSMRGPSESLDAFLAGMEGVGRVVDRSESVTDMTVQYTDCLLYTSRCV